MTRRDALDAFVGRARAVTCEEEAARRGLKLARSGSDLVGPCQICGGKDTFGISRVKGVFICRKGGAAGDAIAMVQHLDGVDFLSACSILTGEPVPRSDAAPPDPAEVARREAERRARIEQRDREAAFYRERARREAYTIWRQGRGIVGTSVEAYLSARGLPLMTGLRWQPDLPYWADVDDKPTKIYSGPVMIAPVQRPDGKFGAVHLTWLDPAKPGSKASIVHPVTGKTMPVKKVKGVKKGGAIRLTGPASPARMVTGEGIETTASAWKAERHPGTAYWAAVDLGNLGGRATGSVIHPDITVTDKAGRERRWRYAGPDPDMADDEAFVPPEGVRDWVLLGDGDSERLSTEATLTRGARRAMRLRPGLVARIAMAPPGSDFNDVLRGAAAIP